MSSVSRTDANNQTGGAESELDIHPTSKWVEAAREDELTLWEVHRRPRAQVRQDRRIRCSLKLLNPHFQCVICLGYLKETTIVMVCLHRFCSECINRCIRIGMKECPSCRKPIPSRRSLRRDKKFDDIINGMMGTAQDRQQTEEIRGLEDAKHMVNLQKAIVSKKQMSKFPKPDDLKMSPCASGAESANTASKHKTIVDLEIPNHVHIELRRHPEETSVDRLERPFLTLRNDVKISFLKGFLKKKLEDREYELTSKLDDESVVLDDKLTLADTKNALFPTRSQKSVMVLKYRVPDSEDSEHLGPDL